MGSIELEHVWGRQAATSVGMCFGETDDAIYSTCGALLISQDINLSQPPPPAQRVTYLQHRPHRHSPSAPLLTCLDRWRSHLAVGDAAGTIVVWVPRQHRLDAANGQHLPFADTNELTARLQCFTGHRGGVLALRWSPDGALIACTGGSDGALSVVDAASGLRVAYFTDALQNTSGLDDVAPDIAWETQIHRQSSAAGAVYTIYAPFHSGARILKVHWDIASLQYKAEAITCQVPGRGGRLGGFCRSFTCVAVAEHTFLCGTTSGDVLGFSKDNGKLRFVVDVSVSRSHIAEGDTSSLQEKNAGGGGVVVALAYLQASRAFLAACSDGSLRMFRISRKEREGAPTWEMCHLRVLQRERVLAIAIAPSEKILAVATTSTMSRRHAWHFLSTSNLESLTELAPNPTGGITAFAVINAAFILVCSADAQVMVMDLSTYRVVASATLGVDVLATCCGTAVREDGGIFAACGTNAGSIILFYAERLPGPLNVWWSTAHAVPRADTAVASLDLSIRGNYLFSVARELRMWALDGASKGLLVRSEVIGGGGAHATVVRTDVSSEALLHVVSPTMHRLLDLSRVPANACAAFPVVATMGVRAEEEEEEILSMALHPTWDGVDVLWGTSRGRVVARDLDDVRAPPKWTLEVSSRGGAATPRVSCIDVSSWDKKHRARTHDDAALAVGTDDGTTAVYRVAEEGRPHALVAHVAHPSAVVQLRWIPEGRQLVTTTADGAITLWNVFCAE